MTMLSDELRKRLADGKCTDTPKDSVIPVVSPFKERLRLAAQVFLERDVNIPSDKSIGEVLDGIEVQTASGRFYLVEPDPHFLHPEIDAMSERHLSLRDWSPETEDTLSTQYRSLIGPEPERILYLDIETAGFAGNPLFLVGLMYLEAGKIKISQLLARDYSEEGALLEDLAERFVRFDCMITFNGKTFDAPFIRDRYFANAVRCRFPRHHLDLLHPSRRRWGDKLPDCRLETLERWICGQKARDGDIPGAEIPDTYHLFVRTGNAALLSPILEHNALDLVSMGDLLFCLLE